MKVKAKNIAVRLLSMLLCLHMLYMISGRTSWYSDVFASYRSQASVITVSDPVNESTPESDATADDSAPVSSMPDQEESSEILDYLYISSDCLLTLRLMPLLKQVLTSQIESSLQTAVSEITPPPPKLFL
jgi:hypothetical protein